MKTVNTELVMFALDTLVLPCCKDISHFDVKKEANNMFIIFPYLAANSSIFSIGVNTIIVIVEAIIRAIHDYLGIPGDNWVVSWFGVIHRLVL